MKRVELNKIDRQPYALTFDPQIIPPMTHKISKKRMRLNYKKYKRSIRDNGDISLQSMSVG